MFSSEFIFPLCHILPLPCCTLLMLSLTIISYARCTWFLSLLLNIQENLGSFVSIPNGLLIYSQVRLTGSNDEVAATHFVKRKKISVAIIDFAMRLVKCISFSYSEKKW